MAPARNNSLELRGILPSNGMVYATNTRVTQSLKNDRAIIKDIRAAGEQITKRNICKLIDDAFTRAIPIFANGHQQNRDVYSMLCVLKDIFPWAKGMQSRLFSDLFVALFRRAVGDGIQDFSVDKQYTTKEIPSWICSNYVSARSRLKRKRFASRVKHLRTLCKSARRSLRLYRLNRRHSSSRQRASLRASQLRHRTRALATVAAHEVTDSPTISALFTPEQSPAACPDPTTCQPQGTIVTEEVPPDTATSPATKDRMRYECIHCHQIIDHEVGRFPPRTCQRHTGVFDADGDKPGWTCCGSPYEFRTSPFCTTYHEHSVGAIDELQEERARMRLNRYDSSRAYVGFGTFGTI
ncbi:hypothetical protein GGR57DRAFT_513844 [Xylariaceae sp. FL1272]|nr:hypothetical protein GGR57DRAFT_513844 [Xylariaceae sp. FL1272]